MNVFYNCLAVALGGAVGSVARYAITLIPIRETVLFPIKTFCVNVVGCLIIGVLIGLAGRSSSVSPRMLLLLKVGFCGGFTTFSTFGSETELLISGGHIGVAVLYVVLSVAVGVSAVFLGQWAVTQS